MLLVGDDPDQLLVVLLARERVGSADDCFQDDRPDLVGVVLAERVDDRNHVLQQELFLDDFDEVL